jgi:hypothetical protein
VKQYFLFFFLINMKKDYSIFEETKAISKIYTDSRSFRAYFHRCWAGPNWKPISKDWAWWYRMYDVAKYSKKIRLERFNRSSFLIRWKNTSFTYGNELTWFLKGWYSNCSQAFDSIFYPQVLLSSYYKKTKIEKLSLSDTQIDASIILFSFFF